VSFEHFQRWCHNAKPGMQGKGGLRNLKRIRAAFRHAQRLHLGNFSAASWRLFIASVSCSSEKTLNSTYIVLAMDISVFLLRVIMERLPQRGSKIDERKGFPITKNRKSPILDQENCRVDPYESLSSFTLLVSTLGSTVTKVIPQPHSRKFIFYGSSLGSKDVIFHVEE
jgi:hypothetical protein